MRKKTIQLLLACLALTTATLTPTTAVAQTASHSTGAISGRVQNVATGQYLNNARVSVKGSNNIVFTDKDGTYRLVNVPSGPVLLEVFFTDLDLATVPINVRAGGLVTQDVNLTSVARYGQHGDGTVKLDAFIVAQDRRPMRRPSPPTNSASRPISKTSCRPTRSVTCSAAPSASS